MEFELQTLKKLRKAVGLTQQQLAKQAEVSQSLIAKIESGNLDPTYSNVQKIASALERLHHHQEQKAKDIMQKKVITIKPKETLHEVIEKMRKHSISQLPVLANTTVVGMISETAILDGILHHKGKIVQDIMEEAPPIIAPETRVSIVSSLLQFSPLVLVAEKGNLKGVITKSDVLSKIKVF